MAAKSNRVKLALRRNAVQTAKRAEVRTLAVGYLRVSTEEQAQSGFGLDAQEDAVRKYADAVGLELIDVIADPGISGTTRPSERPGFREVMALAVDRRFSVLLVKRFDRLARNIALAVTTSAELDTAHGVTIRSVTEAIDTGSPSGKLIFSVFSAMAENERDAIVDRTKGGRMQKAGKGGFAGGRIPYGYVSDGRGGLAIEDRTAAVVLRIFSENGAGRGLQAIADGLNHDEIPSPRGRRWWPSNVSYILGNAVYAGQVEYVFITGGNAELVSGPGTHAGILR
ncbi:recombinase family protein [Methylobacterium sp. WL120]|uniref:recombinase family protein n=1 Tax=Methylobacterium sp. WL120 TaxID=2603887 RepID=UPI0011C8C70D|nr:recombinase family protein [Methylobacterium sp. WL120]TXM65743.1 recombinase family protein [Methylobacterium sp. WL120]